MAQGLGRTSSPCGQTGPGRLNPAGLQALGVGRRVRRSCEEI